MLVRDDGPGKLSQSEEQPLKSTLGLRIMYGFAQQLQGTLKMKRMTGMTVRLDFPKAPTMIDESLVDHAQISDVHFGRSGLGIG